MLSKLLLTEDQEEQRASDNRGNSSYKKDRIKPRTRQGLWNLKCERPELFARDIDKKVGSSGDEEDRLAGFEACGKEGVLHNPGRGLFLEVSTGRRLWFDNVANDYKEYHEGSQLALQCISGAATCLGVANRQLPLAKGTSASNGRTVTTSSGSSAKAAPRHIFIPDLHRTAKAVKVDIEHLDQPASLITVLGVADGERASSTDAVAVGLHVKLTRRLAGYRGKWADDALCGALAGALQDIVDEHNGTEPLAAVALFVGRRAVLLAATGASYTVCKGALSAADAEAPQESNVVVASAKGAKPMTAVCMELDDPSEGLFVSLIAGADSIPANDDTGTVTRRLQAGRPRAASIDCLQKVRMESLDVQMVVACARWGLAIEGSNAQKLLGGPPAKKQKLEQTVGKIRVRQILLRHWRGTGPEPTDPVRRKAVRRTPEEAEKQMLKVLDDLEKNHPGGFSNVCKAMSECQSSLKGGELAGDLGWLDKGKGVDSKQANGRTVQMTIPASVLKAAFELEVGQLGDLVSSELGIHLLLRSA